MSFPRRIDKVLLQCTKIIVCLVPLVPLYITAPLTFPFITGKNFAFRVLVEFAVVFWAGLLSVCKEYRPRNSIMVLSVLTFTFVAGLADLFGINPYNSFWSNYERMEGYVTILHLALYFMIIKSVFRTRKDWIVFFSICAAASMFSGLFAFIEPSLFEKTGDYINEYGTRIGGTIGNPPFLASYLLLSVFAAIILMQMIQKIYFKFCLMFAIVINSAVIYMTASRGAILAAFAGAVMIVGYLLLKKLRDRNKTSLKKVLFYMLALLIGLSIIVFAVSNLDFMENNRTVSRFMKASLDDQSIKTRLYTWKIIWNAFKENPVLGWGQENFFGVYTVNPVSLTAPFMFVDRAHNIVLDWLVNAGLLGLSAYLAMFGSAFYILRNALRKEIISVNTALIIAVTLIVYFIQNLFTFDTISTYILFFALLAYIDNIGSVTEASSNILENNIVSKKSRTVSAIVTLFALLVIASISYFVNYIPVKQLQLYTHISQSISKYDSFPAMLDDFDKALSYNSFGDKYIRDGMMSLSSQIIEYQFYDKEGALKLIQRTVEELEKGLTANRYNLGYIQNAVDFFGLLAMYEPSYVSAVETLIEESMRINPQYQRLEWARVDALIIKKDFEGAFDSMKKIAELYPGDAIAQYKLALTAILTLRENVVNEALEKFKKNIIIANKNIAAGKQPLLSVEILHQLAQAYVEVENYDKALQYYREIIRVLPYDKKIRSFEAKDKLTVQAGFHLEMAGIYLVLGDKENAVKEAKKALELDPVNFKGKTAGIID